MYNVFALQETGVHQGVLGVLVRKESEPLVVVEACQDREDPREILVLLVHLVHRD